jgi:predicted nucleotidyltransferase
MKLKNVVNTQKALANLKDAIELEMCHLDIAERSEYIEYFEEIEKAIIVVQDKFFRDWIYNNQLTKNKQDNEK